MRIPPLARFTFVLLLAVVAAGCLAPFRLRTPVPMPSLPLGAAAGSARTVVFLPGTWDRPNDFARHDFAGIARQLAAPMSFVAADAHMGYYRKRSVVTRLHEDFVAPLRAKGQEVWLVGISLGGVGALLYAAENPDEVAGIVLLAPFPGDPPVLDEIRAAGGPLAWAGREAPGTDDWQRRMWSFVRDWSRREGPKPPIFLTYGEGDDFAPGLEMMATLLPPGNVRHRPGGHDWKTWTALWRELLENGALGAPPRP